MINLHNLKPIINSFSNKKRIGRGQGSGKGGTSTRGHKGAKSRSGNSMKIGFEGGQMPLQRRIPKFGFKNRNRVKYKIINLDLIESLINKNKISNILNKEILLKNRMISKNKKIKILGKGELKSSVTITANKFTKKAFNEITKQGGSCIKI